MQVSRQHLGAALPAFLLYGNLHVGVVAAALMLGTYALLQIEPSWPLLLMAVCSAFLVYQADRALVFSPEDLINQPERVSWVAGHRGYVWGTSLVAAGLLLFLYIRYGLRTETFVTGIMLAALSLLYVVPLLPHRRRLKHMGWLKPVVISGVWAVVGVGIPLIEAGQPFSFAVLALIGYRFFIVLANVLLADWPDRQGDVQAGVYTLGEGVPDRRLQQGAVAALIIAIGGALVALIGYHAPRILALDLLGPVLMIWAACRPFSTSRWFYGVVIDLMVAWPAVTALGAYVLASSE